MRVGIVAEQLRQRIPGGIGTYTTGLLRGLMELDDDALDVVAITSRAPGDDPLVRLGVEVVASPLGHRAVVKLWDWGLAIPRGSYDVLHLTSMAGPLPTRGPVTTVMVHDLAWRTHPELTTSRGARWHEAGLKRAKQAAHALITPSDEVAAMLLDDGIAAERVVVIGEGSDHLPSPDHEAATALLDEHQVAASFVLTVSTLEPRKNLGRLVEAHEAASAGGAIPLVIVGPAGWGPDVVAPPGAVLVGAQSGPILAALYERCAAFVYVPISEGFGLPPLEALAHGASVIASSTVPSVRNAPDVVLVDPHDTEGLAGALAVAMRDPVSDEQRARARAFAALHRWRAVAEEHQALWEQLS